MHIRKRETVFPLDSESFERLRSAKRSWFIATVDEETPLLAPGVNFIPAKHSVYRFRIEKGELCLNLDRAIEDHLVDVTGGVQPENPKDLIEDEVQRLRTKNHELNESYVAFYRTSLALSPQVELIDDNSNPRHFAGRLCDFLVGTENGREIIAMNSPEVLSPNGHIEPLEKAFYSDFLEEIETARLRLVVVRQNGALIAAAVLESGGDGSVCTFGGKNHYRPKSYALTGVALAPDFAENEEVVNILLEALRNVELIGNPVHLPSDDEAGNYGNGDLDHLPISHFVRFKWDTLRQGDKAEN